MFTIQQPEGRKPRPWRIVALVTVSCFALNWSTTLPLHAQPNGAGGYLPIDVVDGTPRLEQSDVVYLASGEMLRGRIVNDTLTVHTSYGSIPLQTEWLAGVTFDQEPGHVDRITTVNRNRFAGFLNDPIQFQSETAEMFEWPKHAIDRVIFRQRENESQRGKTRRFLVLENGDLLSGHLLDWDPVSTLGGNAAIRGLEEMELIQFSKQTSGLEILLRNGEEITATLKEDRLRLELDAGPEITLPLSMVTMLYCRVGKLPPEAQRAFNDAGSPTAVASSEPPAPTPDGMVWIQPGQFQLGSYPSEKGHGPDEDPPTEVYIANGFWMGRYEVTQAEFLEVTGVNPSGFQSQTNHPVEKVTWNEAEAYCRKRTAVEREAGRLPAGYVYRLPTEAEWEYACRAGSTTRFHFGDDPGDTELAAYGWFINSSDSSTHPVGQLAPNAWGLHDMHGNVWEWCHDLWQDAYPGGSITNYTGPTDGWLRVARGGSWLYEASFCRSANRDSYGPDNRSSDNGFRVVLARPIPDQ